MSGLTLDGPQDAKDDATTRTTPSLPLPVSEDEAQNYYYGLPSRPLLIARTSTHRWEMPTGGEAYFKPKVLRIVGSHVIEEIWEEKLAPEIHTILGENKVDWSSTDIVRIGYSDEHFGEIILWIGVNPKSLSHELGFDVAQKCKKVLRDRGIDDVEVEIRESKIISLAGPRLLEPGLDTDPTVDLREPFTHTLGITICSRITPWAEGTAAFFLEESGEGKRLLLATARHVVLPGSDNASFEHKSVSQARHDVLVLSDVSFKQRLDAVKKQIKAQDIIISYQEKRIKKLEGKEDDKSIVDRADAQEVTEKTKANMKSLEAFYRELSSRWGTDNSRILGHLIFSPSIAVGDGPEKFTRDVAVIEVDSSKVDPSKFKGNFIDLGHKFPPEQLTQMMYPNEKNSHNFDFPGDRLLPLWMRKPTMYDQDGERCLMVLKNGRTTKLTVGRANNILSFTRKYLSDDDGISMAWAILPFDDKSGPFSAKGDSGSVVVDGVGRIGGILTCGSSATDISDVTYVTPLSFVLETIRGYKPLAKAYPKWAPSD
ncbi:hypothetical protein F5I97DRAFT_1935411 [Phlebopus sp. FC_14]|nr:hypothetical protein F5I97DRAFT_1935411 [Phlebopus sp. FC_14]